MKKIPWRNILGELLIVFVGVSGAFVLNNYRDGLAERHQQEVFYQSFLKDIQNLRARSGAFEGELKEFLAAYDSALAEGQNPNLQVPSDWEFRTNLFIISSAFTESQLAILDTRFASSLSMGSDLIAMIQNRLDEYQRDNRALFLMPGINDQLFDEQGSLHTQYAWLVEDVKALQSLNQNLIRSIDEGAIPATRQMLGLPAKAE